METLDNRAEQSLHQSASVNDTYPERIRDIVLRNGGAASLPRCAGVLAMVLEYFRPALRSEEASLHLSSEEIRQSVEDLCAATVDDISDVMLWLGYRVLDCGGSFEWGMTRWDLGRRQPSMTD